ncbi:transcription initiation factor TFIID subunit 8-like [Olea europaea var. sylvestris]|uniref:transcription initiation factor TFIID subunit 8-like n=1 Tax=Olea europaea var. sylvestris TaxID=158386 RepID=UPI000C1D8ACA|nr:transcription initiation factor TFIID subunit 8-like [Olea europaea var. sylvestris]
MIMKWCYMSDGDGKYGVQFYKRQDKKKNETPGNDDFAQAIARIAVTQVCHSLGYQGFQQSALDTLSDVGVRYIREIVKIATACANLDNRNECNVFDVIQGLEDLGSVQGFSGASDVNHCLTRSRVIRDIIQYAEEAEEFPSAYPIPTFPVVKERKLYASFVGNLCHRRKWRSLSFSCSSLLVYLYSFITNFPLFIALNLQQVLCKWVTPPDEHIPGWLPKFPDPETRVYLNSRVKKEAELAVEGRIEERHMQVERSPLNLQQKLIFNGLEAGLADEPAKAKCAVESNPFLAPPLQFEDKEVS